MLRPTDNDPVVLITDTPQTRRGLSFLAGLATVSRQAAATALNDAAFIWQREIKRHMPVDKGLARASVNVIPARAEDEPIKAQVGSNVEYVPYLEFGRSGGGLWAALRSWQPGADPITHWQAKDMGILDLMRKRDKATGEVMAVMTEKLDAAQSLETEEFAPPFRGAWQLIAARVVEHLKRRLAEAIRKAAGK